MKKIFLLAIALCMVISIVPMSIFSASAATSGAMGSCRWEIKNGSVLVISGRGEMGDNYAAPWGNGITEAIIEEGVTSVGLGAFYHCDKLQKVSLPSTLTKIGGNAFADCKSLTDIVIPDGVTYIGNGAFYNCYALMGVNIPKSVTDIGGIAPFQNCMSLERISVDADNKNYTAENGVLFNKDMTQLIKYPSAKRDASYVVPDTVTTIYASAFEYTEWLEDVVLPPSVTNIGSNAFFNGRIFDTSKNYTSDGGLYLNDCLIAVNNKNLIDFSVKEGTRVIADGVFTALKYLRTVNVPNGVTHIGGSAFWMCKSMTSISLPETVVEIGDSAFLECTSLETVYWGGHEEQSEALSVAAYNDLFVAAEWKYGLCYGGEEHDYRSQIIQEMTCTEDSICENTCRICQYKITDITFTEGHIFGEWKDNGKTKDSKFMLQVRECSACGENETRKVQYEGGKDREMIDISIDIDMEMPLQIISITFAIIVFIIVGGAIIVMLINRKKEDR